MWPREGERAGRPGQILLGQFSDDPQEAQRLLLDAILLGQRLVGLC